MLLTLNASELKSVFKDIKPLFSGCADAALIGFTIEQHILYITCQSSVVYERQLVSEHPGPYSLTVLYQDLSEILPGKGTVELDLTPLFVGVRCDTMSATLQQANGIVSRYKQRDAKRKRIQEVSVKEWARKFTECSPVAKSLKREAPITFKPPYAIMKFSTFWLQLRNDDLDAVMSLKDLKAVAEFSPTEYSVTADAIEFHRNSAVMAVARNTVDRCTTIQEMVAAAKESGKVAGGAYLPKIQQLLRSVGPGECRCFFYEDGVEIVVHRPKVSSSLKMGDCGGKPVAIIPTFLEYVQMIFRLCGESAITVLIGKSFVCLRTEDISMLLSVVF